MAVRSILLMVVSILLLRVAAIAGDRSYENSRYFCLRADYEPGREYDTVAYIEFTEEPALYQRGTVKIQFYSPNDDPKGVTFGLHSGDICRFSWEAREFVIDQPVTRGDTIEVQFSFTPLEVGAWRVKFKPSYNSLPWSRDDLFAVPVGVAIDEHGKFRNTAYVAGCGPTLEATRDSLIITENCACDWMDVNNAFELQMLVKGNFANGVDSEVEFTIIPIHDFPEGVSYLLQWNNGMTLSLADSSDWGPVFKGDTLRLTGSARVLEPGECEVALQVCGYFGETDSNVPRGAKYGESRSTLKRRFFFDESLSYTAMSLSSIIDLTTEDVADGYRLEELKPLLERNMTNSAILSGNYSARTKEIARRRYEQKQVETTPATVDSVETRHDVEQ